MPRNGVSTLKISSTPQKSKQTTEALNLKSRDSKYLFPSLKIGVIIPAYNEELNLGKTLERIPNNVSDNLNVIVVDDGSADRTSEIASKYNIILLRHHRNRGNGAATKTGLKYCKDRNFKIVVILDADGQHDPKYISDFIKPIFENYVDFTIGNRFRYHYDMELKRKICSKIMTAFYFLFLWKKIYDPTNGYRALSLRLLKELEFESNYSLTQEMLYKVVPYYKYKQIPIPVNPRNHGVSFIKLRNYLSKIILLFIKYYIFPRIKGITHKIFPKEFRDRVRLYILKT